MKALINANVFDFESYVENQYILFEKEIIETGPMKDFVGADKVYDCQGSLVMPTFVLGHTHIYSAFAKGWITPFAPNSFKALLEQMWWKLDRGLNLESIYYSGLVSGMEFIKNGVTTVIDHHASGLDIRGSLNTLKQSLCEEIGLRGIFCFESSDRFNIEECIEENITFANYSTDQYAGLFGMHASLSLSDASLKKIATASKDLPIHIHVAESIEDQQDCLALYGTRVIERLDAFDLLRPNSILSHCIHLDEKELEQLSKKDIAIALNPTSNMNNGVGLPNYEQMKEKNIVSLLGNDGLGYNFTREINNFLFTMHHKALNPTAVDLNDVKTLMTNNYAYASQMLNCSLGKIEKGYKADFMTIPYTPFTPMNANNAMGHFFYGICDHFRPENVWCNGVIKLEGYEMKLKEEAIYLQAQKIAKAVWERIAY
ncbi:cytosine/adenosine deaminase-related metal-dependent hydrolase [Natranaerovirga hydrolytica]|uniref:Cytosine/adenosine deaminase-related metal-dependent hydrolase n=1 Tax=Natranaerovirga hydrolytica TaxID=680378 RepID=A0A4V2Q1I7_9FIRM|nr:amidohydrolase family protein [Natranaerovirga hydrolytica]TCK97751.1 cytosine/adenosine deaminase-related metal-dependent hydrolase [Natranaerovirga hydrolytica]